MGKPSSTDTVTPLDGDGQNVVIPPEGSPQVPTDNVPPEDYDTRGQTTVATPRGYRFSSSDKEIPVIDVHGVQVTSAQADALIKESDDLVYKVVTPADQDKE